jgi:hypothetical protein
MDAYIFAGSATSGAISTLTGGVGQGGPARVVCPTSGDRALYVAVSAANETDLNTKISDVLATSGLSSTTTYIALSGVENTNLPTYHEVLDHLGFDVLTGASPSSIASSAAQISGVVGVAVVNGSLPARVLVESTATTTGALDTIMDNVEAISGATLVFAATGETANGAGF